jgi:hypothetical protein
MRLKVKKGLNRILWDFRYGSFGPVDLTTFDESFVFSSPETGYMAMPGNYKVSLSKFEDGVYTELVSPQPFKCVALNAATLSAPDKKAVDEFSKKMGELRRVTAAVDEYRGELVNKLKYINQALIETPKLTTEVSKTITAIEKRLNWVNKELNGDATLVRREFETIPSINGRIGYFTGALSTTTATPSTTQMNNYAIAVKQLTPVYNEIKALDADVRKLEDMLEKSNAPYTPGRLPEWKGN